MGGGAPTAFLEELVNFYIHTHTHIHTYIQVHIRKKKPTLSHNFLAINVHVEMTLKIIIH